MQELGNAAEYLRISGSGRNALDFHIAYLPFLKIANAGSEADKVAAIVANLRSRGTSRPRKLKTLSGTIKAQFQKSLGEADVEVLIQALLSEGYLTLDGESVSYNLPTS
ncbi:MAG: hypothetical protein RIC56_04840 [Pseudomonadales bacterium]